MAKLKTEDPSDATRRRMMRAARARFGRRAVLRPVFEHGQWWLSVDVGGEEQLYSVVDAVGGRSIDGFDFEEL